MTAMVNAKSETLATNVTVVDPDVPRTSTEQRAITEVAVGILINSQGQFLLTTRPTGKVYAGYWEFPGGKIEAGETVVDAAIREIDEELGIRIRTANLWRRERFSYEHAHVELNFCRTSDWSGEPHGREGQAFAWQSPHRIAVSPLLPALHAPESDVLAALRG